MSFLRFGGRPAKLGHTSLAGVAGRQPGGVTSGTFDTGKRKDPFLPYGTNVVARAAYNASVRAQSSPGKFASLIAKR